MEAENPFKTPAAELTNPLSQTTAAPLYKLGAVGVATFLGSPLAGAYLLGKNLQALGRGGETGAVWGIAIAIFVVCMALAFILPESVPAIPFTIAQVAGMFFLAQQRIGPVMVLHTEQGGPLYSNWRAAGIGLLFGLGMLAVVLVVMLPLVLLELI